MQPIKALQCEDEDETVSNSYIFAIPEENWFFNFPNYTKLEPGQTLTISGSCNPNYEYPNTGRPEYPWTCKTAEEYKYICNWRSNNFIRYGIYNENGHLESFLQCPQCGCGAEGAANINDLYAADQAGSRKVSEIEPDAFFKKILN